MFYATKTRDNLPIYGVRQKTLGMYTTQDSDVVKGISRVPMTLARLQEEDLINLEELELRKSQCFDLPEIEEIDLLNQAFQSIVLLKGEISPTLSPTTTEGNDEENRRSAVLGNDRIPVFGGQEQMEQIKNKLTIAAAAREEEDEDDGTPLVVVIDADNDESFTSIYEHRRRAKDCTINNSEALMFPDKGPLNNSSFMDLLAEHGESQLLYSKSGERDRAALE